MSNYQDHGLYGLDYFNQRATPDQMRRQRELAAMARGEVLDEINQIMENAVKSLSGPVSLLPQTDPDTARVVRVIRRALADNGYSIVPGFDWSGKR